MGTSTKASGKTTYQTVRDKPNTPTAVDTTENSWTTKGTVKGYWLRREKSSMGISSTTKWTVSVFYSFKTDNDTKVNGLTTKNTDLGSINGQMDACIRAITLRGKGMVRERWYTRTERSMRVVGWMGTSMGGEFIGLGRINWRVSGVRDSLKRNFTD